jgi:hypothetical protein
MIRLPATKEGQRKIGLGANPLPDEVVKVLTAACMAPLWAQPTIAEVVRSADGPLPDATVQSQFGPEIFIMGEGDGTTTGLSVTNTPGLQDAEFQTYFVVCAIAYHLRPQPMSFVVRGNATPRPQVPGGQQFSPDAFDQNDTTTVPAGFNAPLVAPTTVPAYLWWGEWINYAMWNQVAGYRMRISYGQHLNLMDEELRNTAYIPPLAQLGSASSSLIDVYEWVRQTNDVYVSTLGTTLLFSVADAQRFGSIGAAGANFSVFHPSRDDEFVEQTIGGIDLRTALADNTEFRSFAQSFMVRPGVKFGARLEETDAVYGALQRAYLSAAFATVNVGGGSVPPVFTQSGLFNPGFTSPFEERTIDNNNVPQAVPNSRATFKGGPWDTSFKVVGWELEEDGYNYVKNNKDVQNKLLSACGCCCP